ncbi:Galectin-4-like [Aphelenchoides bicaudatus]|nr:Galectin-4-like [Aphelenchoides bicaudatus]
MRRPGAIVHHMPSDFSDASSDFKEPSNMQHFDLGDGVRVGIGHNTLDNTFESEDSIDSSEFELGQGFEQRFFTDRSGEIKREQFNLRMPFRQLINGFHSNERIRLVGKHTSNRWALDLCRGKDRLFHLSSRLDQRCIVRNDLQKGHWNEEERDGGQPLEKSKMFTMDLVSIRNGDTVQIMINGKKFAEFETREPLEAVDRLEISAGIELHMLGLYDEDD